VKVAGHVSSTRRGRPLGVANHDSLLDALLVALFLPGDPLIVLAARRWRAPVLGCLVRRLAECAELGADGNYTIKGWSGWCARDDGFVVFPQDG